MKYWIFLQAKPRDEVKSGVRFCNFLTYHYAYISRTNVSYEPLIVPYANVIQTNLTNVLF